MPSSDRAVDCSRLFFLPLSLLPLLSCSCSSRRPLDCLSASAAAEAAIESQTVTQSSVAHVFPLSSASLLLPFFRRRVLCEDALTHCLLSSLTSSVAEAETGISTRLLEVGARISLRQLLSPQEQRLLTRTASVGQETCNASILVVSIECPSAAHRVCLRESMRLLITKDSLIH